MRYGYWLPVFGGWLRNVDDERMEASWKYNSRLARRSEEIGYDLTLVAELNLNDIKGVEAPSLDAWSTAAALAAVTERLELMVAGRPTFHQPALLAKQAATGQCVNFNVNSNAPSPYMPPPGSRTIAPLTSPFSSGHAIIASGAGPGNTSQPVSAYKSSVAGQCTQCACN